MIEGAKMISVIIPTYNRAKTIERSIHSVLSQTYRDIELIIVDDCSTDNTFEVIKGIDDERLCYVKLDKNSGACVARNKGIDLARGEYIAFQDSDDEWYPEKLEKQLEALKKIARMCVFVNLRHIMLKGTSIIFSQEKSRMKDSYHMNRYIRA